MRTHDPTPERSTSNSSTSSRMRKLISGSLRRRKSKADPSPPPSPDQRDETAIVELDASAESELGAELPARPQSDEALHNAQEERKKDNALEKLTNEVEKYIQSLHFLGGVYVSGAAQSQGNAISKEIILLGDKASSLCINFFDLHDAFSQPLCHDRRIALEKGKRAVHRFLQEESQLIQLLFAQLQGIYRSLRPGNISREEAQEAFKDLHSARATVETLDNPSYRATTSFNSLLSTIAVVETIQQRVSFMRARLGLADETPERSSSTSRRHQTESKLGRLGTEAINISDTGDIILDFGTSTDPHQRLQFRVSSQLLSASCPLFAYALSREKPLHKKRSVAGIDDVIRFMPWLVNWDPEIGIHVARIPYDEYNLFDALTILLRAAHMRMDLVPRKVEFCQFIEISRLCHRYRFFAPVEIIVECYWLPQWRPFAHQPGYDAFLYISFVFGIEDIFLVASRRLILSLDGQGRHELLEMLPDLASKHFLKIRKTLLYQITSKCKSIMDIYLSSSRESALAERTTGNASQNIPEPVCPKQSVQCDATNLGWLMMKFGEMGILQAILDPLQTLQWTQQISIDGLLNKLATMARPPDVHGKSRAGNAATSCDCSLPFKQLAQEMRQEIMSLDLSFLIERFGRGKSLSADIPQEEVSAPDAPGWPNLQSPSTTSTPSASVSNVRDYANPHSPDEVPRENTNRRKQWPDETKNIHAPGQTTQPVANTQLRHHSAYTVQHAAHRDADADDPASDTDATSVISTEIEILTDRGRVASSRGSSSTISLETITCSDTAVEESDVDANGPSASSDDEDFYPTGRRRRNRHQVSFTDTDFDDDTRNQEAEKFLFWESQASNEVIPLSDKHLILASHQRAQNRTYLSVPSPLNSRRKDHDIGGEGGEGGENDIGEGHKGHEGDEDDEDDEEHEIYELCEEEGERGNGEGEVKGQETSNKACLVM